MTYVSFAVFYEGDTERVYLNALLPKVMQEIILQDGIINSTIPDAPAFHLTRAGVSKVAEEFCANREAVHLVFVHADTGGRNQERNMGMRGCAYCDEIEQLCKWPQERCIVVAPRHETEAWILTDRQAIADALGFRGNLKTLRLPSNGREAERIGDPKAELARVIGQVRRGRRDANPLALMNAVAQGQSLANLRTAPSFRRFEDQLRTGLRSLGCIA